VGPDQRDHSVQDRIIDHGQRRGLLRDQREVQDIAFQGSREREATARSPTYHSPTPTLTRWGWSPSKVLLCAIREGSRVISNGNGH
jgi:hypothetical protein